MEISVKNNFENEVEEAIRVILENILDKDDKLLE